MPELEGPQPTCFDKVSCSYVNCSSAHKARLPRYVIKVVEQTARGNETRLLYAGPLDNTKAVFGVGKFHLFAGETN